MAGIHPRDSGVQERLQDLLVAKGPKDASAEQRGVSGRWDQACIAATARAVDVTNASPRATPRAMTSG
jgi:hypothetical protein